MERKCVGCKSLIPIYRNKKADYCSDKCRRRLAAEQYKSRNYDQHELKVCTGTVGAINELRVCVDILSKGFEVFRAVSPSCSCDLAIIKNKKLTRVEVTTGHFCANGKLFSVKKDKTKFDLLAIVTKTKIIYSPEGFLCQE